MSKKNYMIVPYELRHIFIRKLPPGLPDHVHRELSYEEMICLAALYKSWADEQNRPSSQRAEYFITAWHLNRLAEHLGDDWKALSSKKLSIYGVLAEEARKIYEVVKTTKVEKRA